MMITEMVRILDLQGKRVLITAHQHSALDNLLFKLEKLSIDFVRLGRSQNVCLLIPSTN